MSEWDDNSSNDETALVAASTEVEDATMALDGWIEFNMRPRAFRPDLLTNIQSKRLVLWDVFLSRFDPTAKHNITAAPPF